MLIPNLGRLISRAWLRAELAVRNRVRLQLHDSDEEQITWALLGELREEFERISANGEVERTFLEDLQQAFPYQYQPELLETISEGLIATVNFHDRAAERLTGGDLGIVLTRPDVEIQFGDVRTPEYRRGLLCQAKILRRNSKWGDLTPIQRKILPEVLKFFALLLYRYAEQDGTRRSLNPFAWQLAREATPDSVRQWLRTNQFPDILTSEDVLMLLATDQIGTDDKRLIDKYVAPPPKRPALEIHIKWKDDDDPGPRVRSRNRNQSRVEQHIRLRN